MKTFLLLTLAVLSISSNTKANDEYDAILVDGPGVLSGDKGQFDIQHLFGDKQQISQPETKPVTSRSTEEQSTGTTEFKEFKHWQQAKQAQTAEYQEFLDWRAYLQYKRANP